MFVFISLFIIYFILIFFFLLQGCITEQSMDIKITVNQLKVYLFNEQDYCIVTAWQMYYMGKYTSQFTNNAIT